MSNKLFTRNGTSYPFQTLRESLLQAVLTKPFRRTTISNRPAASFTDDPKVYTDSSGSQQVNETRYEEVGLSYAGAQFTWGIFMVLPACRLRNAKVIVLIPG